MFKPDILDKLGEILKIITAHNLHIANIKMCKLNEHHVEEIYKDHHDIK